VKNIVNRMLTHVCLTLQSCCDVVQSAANKSIADKSTDEKTTTSVPNKGDDNDNYEEISELPTSASPKFQSGTVRLLLPTD